MKRNSREELSIIDFSEFFKPKGTLDNFFKDFIFPFIDKRSWKNRVVAGRHISLSTNLLNQLKNAQLIKEVYFKANPAVPSMSFQLKPDTMNKKDARFTLELGDQKVSYNHGPKFWKNLTWSGEDENQRVRVIFEDLQGEFHSNVFEGPWAWFHLLDSAKLKNTNIAKVYKMTYSVEQNLKTESGRSMNVQHEIDYMVRAKSINNPFGKDLLGTFRCPESI